jgi:ABC-2 type transport system ATP-binding protein
MVGPSCERMKMELAAALLHKPKVLFLDEPTIGLDIFAQKNIREFLRYYNQQENITMMLTSHYLEDIESLCIRSSENGTAVLEVDKDKTNSLVNSLLNTYDIKDFSVEDIPMEERLETLYISGSAANGSI